MSGSAFGFQALDKCYQAGLKISVPVQALLVADRMHNRSSSKSGTAASTSQVIVDPFAE